MLFMEFNFLLKQIQAVPRTDLHIVATGAVVPLGTLIKIWTGETPNPRIRTVENLAKYMRQQRVAP